MKLFIDTADLDQIREVHSWGILAGCTTNPSLIAKQGGDFIEVIHEICELVQGPVSAEVVAQDPEGMIAEGRLLARVHEHVVVKVPLTEAGLAATRVLADDGIRVNVTLCFQPSQALLAGLAGAAYISPFIGRLDDINLDGLDLVADIRTIYDNYDFTTEILAASVRSVNHVSECAKIGADIVTAPPQVLRALANHPLTDKGLEAFLKDWEKTGQKIL